MKLKAFAIMLTLIAVSAAMTAASVSVLPAVSSARL